MGGVDYFFYVTLPILRAVTPIVIAILYLVIAWLSRRDARPDWTMTFLILANIWIAGTFQ